MEKGSGKGGDGWKEIKKEKKWCHYLSLKKGNVKSKGKGAGIKNG